VPTATKWARLSIYSLSRIITLVLIVAADNGPPALGYSRAAVPTSPVSPAAANRARAAAAGWHLPAAVPGGNVTASHWL
jgi:hypothetical protein